MSSSSSQQQSRPRGGFLADLLAPANLTPQEFFGQYWQKTPIHIPKPSNGEAAAFQNMFGITDMEELWQNVVKGGYAGQDAILIFKNGHQIQMNNPFFAFANEHSVVVNKGDRYSSAIYRICKLLEKDTFPFAFVNVYLTPPNAQTVPAHSDDREVLLLQIEGAKEWSIYSDPPVRLPYKHEEVGKRRADSLTPEQLANPIIKQTVRAGDVLYMPRGYIHEAKTTGSEMSLHLTVALQTSDWDYARLVSSHVKAILRGPQCLKSRECLPVMNLRPTVPLWARSSGSRGAGEKKAQKKTADGSSSTEDEDEEKQMQGMREGYKAYQGVLRTVVAELSKGAASKGGSSGGGCSLSPSGIDEYQGQPPQQQREEEQEEEGNDVCSSSSYNQLEIFSGLLDDYHSSVCGDITAERDGQVRTQLRLVEHPLTLDSMVLWNSKIKFLGTDFVGVGNKNTPQQQQSTTTPTPPPPANGGGGAKVTSPSSGFDAKQEARLPYMLHFDRSGDEMSMGASDQTGPAVAQLVNHHQLCPAQVRELSSLSSDMARLAFVNLLLGNGCLLRVS